MHKGSSWILRLYFAVIAAITLITLMFGAIDLLATGLKTYVITAADAPDYMETCDGSILASRNPAPVPTPKDYPIVTTEQLTKECEARNKENIASYNRMKASNAVRNLALIIIAAPLFGLHFRFVYKDWIEEHKGK
ncbi:MAG: hypothetical protein WC813_03245 [Patescibacteria group bacterium]|jgi:hypothetical protein